MIDEIKAIKSGSKELREFGLVMAGAFFLLGFFKSHFLIPAVIFLVLGLYLHKILMPVQKVWMTFAVCMGWVMTRVILAVLFFSVITPISLMMRVSGNRPLKLNEANVSQSFWVLRAYQPSYEKQF